jgi:hypothetical protein
MVYFYDTRDEDKGFSISLLWVDDNKFTEKGNYQIKFSSRSKVRKVAFSTEFESLTGCLKTVERVIAKLMSQGWQVDFTIAREETHICQICTFETENEPSEVPHLEI